jgi:hypothetical protein
MAGILMLVLEVLVLKFNIIKLEHAKTVQKVIMLYSKIIYLPAIQWPVYVSRVTRLYHMDRPPTSALVIILLDFSILVVRKDAGHAAMSPDLHPLTVLINAFVFLDPPGLLLRLIVSVMLLEISLN